jgi:hypothetical protein
MAERRDRHGAAEDGRRPETSARGELAALIDEIRAVTPSPAEVIEAVRRAAAGDLSPRRLDEIARTIHALYRAR